MKEIALTQGMIAMIDDEWFPIISKWPWYFTGEYAARDIGGRDDRQTMYMHRYITMAPECYRVDHNNQNKLDNQEYNLRVVIPINNYYNRGAQSNNTTGFKGVCYDRSRGLYMASISAERKQHNLGRFTTAEEAARAYNEAAIKLHGEYACLNQLDQ